MIYIQAAEQLTLDHKPSVISERLRVEVKKTLCLFVFISLFNQAAGSVIRSDR